MVQVSGETPIYQKASKTWVLNTITSVYKFKQINKFYMAVSKSTFEYSLILTLPTRSCKLFLIFKISTNKYQRKIILNE